MKHHAVAEQVIYGYRLQRSASVCEEQCVVTLKEEKVVISSEKLCAVTCK